MRTKPEWRPATKLQTVSHRANFVLRICRFWSSCHSGDLPFRSLQQRISEDVRVHLLAVLDFVAAAATATVHGCRVIETVGGKDEHDFAANRQTKQLRLAAVTHI